VNELDAGKEQNEKEADHLLVRYWAFCNRRNLRAIAPSHAADKKRNIVHIVADGLGGKDLAFNGRRSSLEDATAKLPTVYQSCPAGTTVRLYRPRKEILDGTWKFPEAQPQ